jgi:hypothetical protein
MRWLETGNALVAYGSINHKVWPSGIQRGFYAKSGLDVHGPYNTAAEARIACVEIEKKES